MLANAVLPSTVGKILERVRWTQREHSLHALRRITKTILQSIPNDRTFNDLCFLRLLLEETSWPEELQGFKADNNFYKYLQYTELGEKALLYNNTDTLNDGNAYIIMKGGIEEVDTEGCHKGI